MSGSLFSNINGFNKTAVHNIKETEKICSKMDDENDFTSEEPEENIFNFTPFEDDIIQS